MDYIIARKSIVVGARGELADIVTQHDLREVANPSDSDSFLEHLCTALDTRHELSTEELVEEYRRSKILAAFTTQSELPGTTGSCDILERVTSS